MYTKYATSQIVKNAQQFGKEFINKRPKRESKEQLKNDTYHYQIYISRKVNIYKAFKELYILVSYLISYFSRVYTVVLQRALPPAIPHVYRWR